MKNVQYSKVLPVVTGLIFIAVLVWGFRDGVDTTYSLTALGTSSAIFCAALVSYMRKSQLENVQNIKGNVYKLATDERLRFIEESYKLKLKYGMTDADIQEAEMASPMDEFESEALNSMAATSETAMDEASEKVEIQNY